MTSPFRLSFDLSSLRHGLAGVLAVVLAACAGAPAPQVAPDFTKKQSESAIEPVDIALYQARRPLAAVNGNPKGGAVTPPEAKRLLGLETDGLLEVLGTPTFRRRDKKVEIWQYGEERCILDLFLYPKEGHFRVTHMEFRGRDVIRVTPSGCFSQILEARNSPKAS